MDSKRHSKIFGFGYIYMIFIIGIISFIISTFFEPSNLAINLLWVVVILVISSYLYLSHGKIIIDEKGIYIGKIFYPIENITSIKIYDEFELRMNVQTFLIIYYRVGKIKSDMKKVNLSLYDKNTLENEIKNWSEKHRIIFTRKKRYRDK